MGPTFVTLFAVALFYQGATGSMVRRNPSLAQVNRESPPVQTKGVSALKTAQDPPIIIKTALLGHP